VLFHTKAHPFFVSDTTVPDLQMFLHQLAARGGEARALGARLQAAFEHKQWRWLPDYFWSSAHFLSEMPPRLRRALAGARLIILKGDLNYRRAVFDALWETTTPFAEVLDYLSVPVLALRTLKSDTIIGLRPGQADSLDHIDAAWRSNGRRGLIQGAFF
jgi:hypothetical protein